MHIAVVAGKGGVGKTTFALHLGWAAAQAGKRVLAIDLDTQANLTQTLAPCRGDTHRPSANVFAPSSIAPIQVGTEGALFLVPADRTIDGLDVAHDLIHAQKVRNAIRALDYDLVIYDTPPAPGLRQHAPILWADFTVVPAHLDAFSLQALQATLLAITKIAQLYPGMTWLIAPNQLLPTSRRQEELLFQFRNRFGDRILPALPARQAVRNAVGDGVPVWRHPSADKATAATWLDYFTNLPDRIKQPS